MSYDECLELTRDFESFPVAGVNENGENVMVEHYGGDDPYFKVTTFQNNGWARINNYYKDGSMEEIYEK
jgi:hypothetical protein